jgi:hypothetical protein
MSRLGITRSDPPRKIDIRDLVARVPPDHYRENLRKIAEYGQLHGIPVIFVVLKDNPYYSEMVRVGLGYRERGDNAHAVRAFRIGLMGAAHTLSRRYLAETYDRTGQPDKAAEVARMELQADTIGGFAPIYLDSLYNDLMIDVGREMGAGIVDARAMLDANPELFLDMSHPDAVAQSGIAQLVLDAVKTVAPDLARDVANVRHSPVQQGATLSPHADTELRVRTP